MDWQNSLLFEFPGSEQIRLFLRIETLLERVHFFLPEELPIHSKSALEALLDIVTLIDRPDIKGLFVKELPRYQLFFTKLMDVPNVDKSRLDQVLTELESLIEAFNRTHTKLAQGVRDHDFLSSIRLYRANPGGVANYDVPGYFHWLHTPHRQRTQQILTWLQEMDLLFHAARFILHLVRDSNVIEFQTATDGLFQTSLDPKLHLQLVRVILPADAGVYPEVSVGKHRLYVRFLLPNLHGKPNQTSEEVLFKLSTCLV